MIGRDPDDLFAALGRSRFRAKFKLNEQDARFLREKGLDVVRRHASDFIARRLAPADPPGDGRQTPWRGHPVFVAQHATATCCRGCLAKWHGIAHGVALTSDEQAYVIDVIMRWLHSQTDRGAPAPTLFD